MLIRNSIYFSSKCYDRKSYIFVVNKFILFLRVIKEVTWSGDGLREEMQAKS